MNIWKQIRIAAFDLLYDSEYSALRSLSNDMHGRNNSYFSANSFKSSK
ncbi:hypothetical protein A3Q56_08365 [Intoshia linei]|uniref:Uncharacterized protein n=1 Tax=Intoshia linei TaxID=1819745 RepID=A0A177ARE1_9BILA|nr:hypothetical protein A3Q56_08365 [Intoshia linei]